MKWDDMHRILLGAMEKKIPEKAKLVEALSEMLFMEKGAIYRRLCGKVPFSFMEVVHIADQWGISLDNLIHKDLLRTDHFELKLIEYTDLDDIDFQHLDSYISLIASAKGDPHSEIAASSNILPISIYAGFDSLTKYYLFKYLYLFSGKENRIPYRDLTVPERLYRAFRSYFDESRKAANTIYIWDYLIFQYLVTDIKYFSGISLISKDDVQHIREDLFALVDYIEEIALNGCYEETGNSVSFYVSDINFEADYGYLQFNDMYISLVRTFILNSVVSTDKRSFEKIKDWILSLKKSSTLISQSGAVHRIDFFRKQRKMIAEL